MYGQCRGLCVGVPVFASPGGLGNQTHLCRQISADASALVVDEIAVVGSRCGSFAPALRTLAAGRVEVESLIRVRFSLQDGLKAFAKARERDCLKVLLNI